MTWPFKLLISLWIVCLITEKISSEARIISSQEIGFPVPHLDALFLLDGSGSVGIANFEIVKEFVKNISKHIWKEDGRVQIGVVQYSHYERGLSISDQRFIKTHIKIGQYQAFSSFSSAVDNITLQGYTTYTGKALRKVQSDFNETKNYGNKISKRVLILLTDGRATDSRRLPQYAEEIRSIGVIPYVIGVSNYDESELRIIATGNVNDSTRVFTTNHFEGLANLTKKLTTELNRLLDATPKTLSEVLPWLNTNAHSDDRGVQQCRQTKLLVRWSRKVIGLNYDYKLYIEDLLTNSTKKTSVEIMYGSDPAIRISNLKSESDVCSMTYEFYVSSDFSISTEIIAGRIVGDLISVITKVLHKYPSKTSKFVFFDAAGAN